jgi:hypothetical protein
VGQSCSHFSGSVELDSAELAGEKLEPVCGGRRRMAGAAGRQRRSTREAGDAPVRAAERRAVIQSEHVVAAVVITRIFDT